MGWRRISIVTKLSLGLFALLVLLVSAMTFLMRAEVERASFEISTERLDGVTGLLADLLSSSAAQRTAAVARLAGEAPIAAFIATRDTTLRPSVLRALEEFAGAGGRLSLAVEVWDSAGHRILATMDTLPPLDPAVASRELDRAAAAGAGGVGGFHTTQGGADYPVVAPVRSNGAIIGALVERRTMAADQQGVIQLMQLIGSDARMLIGNTDGRFWTDLVSEDAGPPVDARQDSVVRYRRDGGEVLARVTPIPGTDWLVALEFPTTTILTHVERTLRRATTLAAILVLLGTTLGVLMSRSLSLPLKRLTAAAEAIARGSESVRVDSNRHDEIGRLAGAFNTMVERVQRGRRTLERRVAKRTAALEAANAELESFSYSVSHDLRAPLRAVDGFAAVLEEDYASDFDPDAQRYLRLIRSNAQQMGHLIDDLLAFSRLGRQQLTISQVDMTDLARTVISETRGRDDAEFTLDPLPPVAGERTMLKQVLANYVQNAVKFSRGRSPARVHVGFIESDHAPVYFVRDNGVGFDMRYADKLFGVFQRLHPTDQFEGTGVGLAIVQRIVHRHGGRVWAEGTPDGGATFYFSIPQRAEPADVRVDLDVNPNT